MQDGHAAARRHSKDGAEITRAARAGRPVEVAILRLDQGCERVCAVGGATGKLVQNGHAAARSHPIDRPGVGGAARTGRPVEISVGALDERREDHGGTATGERVQSLEGHLRAGALRAGEHQRDERRQSDQTMNSRLRSGHGRLRIGTSPSAPHCVFLDPRNLVLDCRIYQTTVDGRHRAISVMPWPPGRRLVYKRGRPWTTKMEIYHATK